MKIKTAAASVLLAATLLCACTDPGPQTTDEVTEAQTTTAVSDTTETDTEAETAEVPEEVKTFNNPISDKSMPDPFIVYHDGYYYGLATEVTAVRLYRSERVEELFISGECKELIKTGDDVGGGKTLGWNVWAPELHYVPTTDRWYVYSCACVDGFDFGTMRMFCLESETSDPYSDYTFKGFTKKNNVCIDQTVYFDEASGNLYTAYCSFGDPRGQIVMISTMSEPWRVGARSEVITYPRYRWEKRGTDENNDGRVNEGACFLRHGDDIFLIYSASGCWSEWYCLGMLRYKGADTSKENFINPKNWEKSKEPVFSTANGVYGVGHCSFFNSPDGTEVWISYHGMATPDAGVDGRYAYIQKIDFAGDGTPVFGEPVSRDTAIRVPSGQK